jgi:hypothetical protein
MKKTIEELERDARKRVADFNSGPRGRFLLAMTEHVNQQIAGVRGKFKAIYQQHRTIQ